MNVELIKVKKTVYVVILILSLSVCLLVWLLSRSFVTIEISPRTASFWLDGTEQKVIAGEVKVNTSIGDHLVRVEADGYVGQNATYNFGRGFSKKIIIALSELQTPTSISNDSTLLSKGTNFNDGYYLANNTLYRLKVGLDDNSNVSVLENQAITENKITDVKSIIWSPTKELALLRHSNSVTLFDFMKYDFIHQTESAWGGSDIGSITWSPDNSRIAYYYAPSSGERSLIFANITNTEIERVYNFKNSDIENPILHWSPDSKWLLIIPQNSDATKNNIYLFNSYNRTIKTLTDDGYKTDASFSPDNNTILYASNYGSTKAEIYKMDKNGDNKIDLGFQNDFGAIAWTSDSANLIVASEDNNSSIYEYNIETKNQQGFVVNNLGTKISTVSITDDGKILIYQAGGRIYALGVQ